MGSAFFRWWLEYFSVKLVYQDGQPLPPRPEAPGAPCQLQKIAKPLKCFATHHCPSSQAIGWWTLFSFTSWNTTFALWHLSDLYKSLLVWPGQSTYPSANQLTSAVSRQVTSSLLVHPDYILNAGNDGLPVASEQPSWLQKKDILVVDARQKDWKLSVVRVDGGPKLGLSYKAPHLRKRCFFLKLLTLKTNIAPENWWLFQMKLPF